MIKNIQLLLETTTNEIKNNFDVAVLGLSGGVDSLVCATLATLALGSKKVYCVHMPFGNTDISIEGKFNDNSVRIANKLNVEQIWKPIGILANTISNHISASSIPIFSSKPLSDLNMGNSRSRARMCVLYGIAHHLEMVLKKRVRVIGTGNLSEDFIGYDTKFGDSAADIFLIGELLKSEVYQLAEHFVEMGLIDKKMIDYTPSAGLWDGQSDEKELGYSYTAMESSILKLRDSKTGQLHSDYENLNNPKSEKLSEIDLFVLKRHLSNRHKHLAPPNISLREFCDEI